MCSTAHCTHIEVKEIYYFKLSYQKCPFYIFQVEKQNETESKEKREGKQDGMKKIIKKRTKERRG